MLVPQNVGKYYVEVEDINGCVAVSPDFNYHELTYLQNTEALNIQIFPNPVQSILYVVSNLELKENTQIELFDLNGKLLWQQEMNESVTK